MPSIYISAVPEEFASYRDKLATELRRRGCSVAWAGTFEAGDGSLLEKINSSLKHCDAVVSIMGERYGDEPPKEEASAFGSLKHSYLQWEYVLAKRAMTPIHVFFPQPQAPRDQDDAENKAVRAKQERFWHESIEASGVQRVSVADADEFVSEALDVLKIEDPDEVDPDFVDPWAVPLNEGNPYVGFRSFEREDTLQYFGRDRLSGELLSRIHDHPFTVLLGHSGVGKSSLLHAGIIPKFEEHYGDRARVFAFSTGDNPYDELTKVMQAAGYDREQVATFTRPHLADLNRSKEFSTNVFRELEKRFQKKGQRWLIVIDDFEHLFTHRIDPELRRCWIMSIIDIVEASSGAVTLLLAMRDDFYGEMRGYPDLAYLADEHFIRMSELRRRSVLNLMEGLAETCGVVFESALIDRIYDDMGDQVGILPRLQYTMQALWNEEDISGRVLKLETYESIGGLNGSLENATSVLHARMNRHDERALRTMLNPLVQIDDPQVPMPPTLRPASRDKVIEAGDEDLLDRMISVAKLLRTREIGEHISIELAHDSLIEAWPQLRRWVRDSREALMLHRQLKRDAQLWENLRKAEKWDESRDELWRGSRVARIEELDSDDQFSRTLPLGQTERRFLDACMRRKDLESVISLRKRLRLSAERWKSLLRERRKKEARLELWRGVELDSALQNHANGRFQEISDFTDLSALQQVDLEFLKACQAHRNAVTTKLRVRLATVSVLALALVGVVAWEISVARKSERPADGSPSTRLGAFLDQLAKKPSSEPSKAPQSENKPASTAPNPSSGKN